MPNHGNNQFDKTYRLKDVNRQTSSWMHEILHYLLILFAYQILFSWIIMQIRKTLKSGIVHFTLLLWCKLMNTLVITKKDKKLCLSIRTNWFGILCTLIK